MHFHNVCNLDNRIRLCLRKLAFFSGALDIEREDSQRCNLRILTLAWQALHVVKILHIQLVLSVAQLVLGGTQAVCTSFNSDPRHTNNFIVNHETKGVGKVRFIGHTLKSVFCALRVCKGTVLKQVSELINVPRECGVYLKECCLVFLVMHHSVLILNQFYRLYRLDSHPAHLVLVRTIRYPFV